MAELPFDNGVTPLSGGKKNGLAQTMQLSPRHHLDRYFKDLPNEVAAVTLVAFCVALGFGIVAPVVPVFATSFGVSAFWASAVISVFALMRLISAAPAGWAINRVGERTVLWTGLSIVAISSALAGLSGSFVQLLILRGLGGTGSAMFTVSAMSLILRTVDPAHRGRATSTYQSGFLFGGLAGPAVGASVVALSIRAPFFVYAGTLTLAAMTAYFGLPRVTRASKQEIIEVKENSAPEMQVREALKVHAYWTALSINLATGMAAFGLRSSLLPLFVIQALHKPASVSSIGWLVSSVAQAALLLPAGRMTDVRGRKPPLVIGTIALLAAMLSLMIVETLPSYYFAMLLMGVGGAFLGAAPAAVIGDVVGSRRGGQVVAVYQMTSDFGMIVGPLLAGYLKDLTSGFVLPFAVGLFVVIGATVMALFMTETKSQALIHPEGLAED